MDEPNSTGSNPFRPLVNSELSVQHWLTVSDAVIRCTERGLPRTPKTIRKWAARSFSSPETADISVRREDIDNGFRWSIEASSLDRKIDEELEYEARKSSAPDQTSAHQSEQVPSENVVQINHEPPENASEPVRTSEEKSGNGSAIEKELRAQLDQKIQEVEFLREELTHRRKTDQALGSVIEAFKLNAETTRAQLLGSQSEWNDTNRREDEKETTFDFHTPDEPSLP
jgi:hypothetical protein